MSYPILYLNERPLPVRTLNMGLSGSFEELIYRMLSEKKTDRPTVDEIIQLLKNM